jgi:pimeloyl-ACP methyl ester carboxylesterase
MNLILVPGLLCDTELWAHQTRFLADIANCRVATVSEADTVEAMATIILADAPDRFALAGLSMGGYVCHAIMRRAPERVIKLALLDTSARADTPEQSERRRQLISMSDFGKFRGVTNRLLPLLIDPDSRGQLADYDLPTLVACGRQDALTPLDLHEEMAAAIPAARLTVIEECGHLSAMEQPQAVTALLRQWLLYN